MSHEERNGNGKKMEAFTRADYRLDTTYPMTQRVQRAEPSDPIQYAPYDADTGEDLPAGEASYDDYDGPKSVTLTSGGIMDSNDPFSIQQRQLLHFPPQFQNEAVKLRAAGFSTLQILGLILTFGTQLATALASIIALHNDQVAAQAEQAKSSVVSEFTISLIVKEIHKPK